MKCLFFFLLIPINFALSQTISGFSGLFTIPSGEIFRDRTICFSLALLDKNYVTFGGFRNNGLVYSGTITYLPFIEINTNFVYLLDYKGKQGIGDRSVGFRLQLLNQNLHYINFSAGINNIGTALGGVSAIHKQSIYFVTSRKLFNDKVEIVAGHGFKVFKAADYQFIGIFGGFLYRPFNFLELMIENDAEVFNAAMRLTLLKHIKILLGLMNMKNFSGGMALSFVL